MELPNNTTSKIISGMMRLVGRGQDEAFKFLDYAYGEGVIWYDHADIYGNGECEKLLGNG